jgi:O-antigen ligase
MIRKIAFSLILLMIFLIPWEGALSIPVVGSLTRVVGLLLILVWCILAVWEKKIRKPHAFLVVFFLFVIWVTASFFWSDYFKVTRQSVLTDAQLFLMALVLWNIIEKPSEITAGLQAYVFGCWVAVATTFYNFYIGKSISLYETGRYSSEGVNAVELTLLLSLAIAIAWYLATSSRFPRPLRIANIVFIPAALFASVLTGSRTGLFTSIVAILYILLSLRRNRPGISILIFSFLAAAGVILLSYIPAATLERLSTAGSAISSMDFGRRGILWASAFHIFLEHPLLGSGAGTMTALIGTLAHNTYLSILGEEGAIGFILFSILLLIVFRESVRHPGSEANFWISLLLIWCIGVLMLTWESRKATWLILTLIVISGQTGSETAKSDETPATESNPQMEMSGPSDRSFQREE